MRLSGMIQRIALIKCSDWQKNWWESRAEIANRDVIASGERWEKQLLILMMMMNLRKQEVLYSNIVQFVFVATLVTKVMQCWISSFMYWWLFIWWPHWYASGILAWVVGILKVIIGPAVFFLFTPISFLYISKLKKKQLRPIQNFPAPVIIHVLYPGCSVISAWWVWQHQSDLWKLKLAVEMWCRL